MSVTVRLPGALAPLADDARVVAIEVPAPADVSTVLDALELRWPALARRIRDETGAVRRHVNVYVDGDDVRSRSATSTPVPDGAVIDVLPAISGG